jgi:hypothetical protein
VLAAQAAFTAASARWVAFVHHLTNLSEITEREHASKIDTIVSLYARAIAQ